jgi:D-serine deaminase-like pyridoxal phosphate-dependent protein
LRDKGIQFETVAVGSTPSCSLQTSFEGITEIHPGNYIFYDRFQQSIGSCNMDDLACSVLTTVIAHYPERNTLMIDAGALGLSKDTGPTDGKDWGLIRGYPQLKITSLSQGTTMANIS